MHFFPIDKHMKPMAPLFSRGLVLMSSTSCSKVPVLHETPISVNGSLKI